MGRRNISRLRKPSSGHDVTKSTSPLLSGFQFETKKNANDQDKQRIRSAKRLESKPKTARNGLSKETLSALRRNIKLRKSAASSRYMRKHRRRIINAVDALAEPTRGSLMMVNLVSENFAYPAGRLTDADAHKILESIRQTLLRYGSSNCDGWMILFLDGEFEESQQEFLIHLHGLATTDFDCVLSMVRKKSRMFRPSAKSSNVKVRTPIQVVRQLTNLPKVIGYCIMSFWPARNRALNIDREGLKEKRKRRPKEPYHSEYLAWLNRYEIQDLCLMIGLEVDANGCLKPTR